MRYAALFLLLLAGCTPGVQDPCAQQCNHLFDSCMETGGDRMTTAHALEALQTQCGAGQQSCVAACRQQPAP